ncbi:MAG: hypothetical protein LBD76_09080, partial [Prevotellaceae bacterium]|nr:hypothetical protein [Prevotellaceae bacterium]
MIYDFRLGWRQPNLKSKIYNHKIGQGEARELPLMGDKSYAFVVKALEFAKQYPEYAALIDVPE